MTDEMPSYMSIARAIAILAESNRLVALSSEDLAKALARLREASILPKKTPADLLREEVAKIRRPTFDKTT